MLLQACLDARGRAAADSRLKGALCSAALHGGLAWILLFRTNAAITQPSAASKVVRIDTFRPPPPVRAPKQPPVEKPALLTETAFRHKVEIEAAAAPVLEIDLNRIELQFADDVSNQLPAVMSSHQGVFALLDKRDPTFARYLIAPPEWRPRQTLIDVSRKLLFSLSPPEKWELLASAARNSAIELGDYHVCALFENAFSACLQTAIRAKVLAQNGFHGQQVRQARLAFAASEACGVSVLDVSFTPLQVKTE